MNDDQLSDALGTSTVATPIDEGEAGGHNSAVVTCTVLNARPVASKTLFAMVDIELLIEGVSFVICGVQARREPDGGSAVRLPTYRGTDGSWLPAVKLPEELRGPVADTVLEYLVEEGLAKRRYGPST